MSCSVGLNITFIKTMSKFHSDDNSMIAVGKVRERGELNSHIQNRALPGLWHTHLYIHRTFSLFLVVWNILYRKYSNLSRFNENQDRSDIMGG